MFVATMLVSSWGDYALNSARFTSGIVRKLVTRAAAVAAVVTAAALVPVAAASAAPATPGAPAATAAPAVQATPASKAAPAAQAAPAANPVAGSSIGDAGVLTSANGGSGAIVTGSDDWWVIYASSAGATVTVTVADNAASNASCASIFAALYDTTGTRNRIAAAGIGAASAQQLSGRSAGSDRYYVEVTTNGCASGAPYSVTLNGGGGGPVPSLAAGSIGAGTSIGSAWPPLQGSTSYPATLSASSSEDWYVLYKKADSTAATIRVSDTTVTGSVNCASINAYLYDNTGTGNRIAATGVSDDGTITYQLPGMEASDSQGRYYLLIWTSCGNGGQTYTVEPEAGAEFANPARVPGATPAPGTSIGTAWPPLQGGKAYSDTLGASSGEDWYLLYKTSSNSGASIRISNTTVDGSVACGSINAWLYDNTGTGNRIAAQSLSTNQATTYTLPGMEASDAQGRYYLLIWTSCGNGGQTYTVEPEASAQFGNPARVPAAPGTPGTSLGRAWPPLQGGKAYGHKLGDGGTEDWYALYKVRNSTPATLRISNTTIDGSVSCGSINAWLYDTSGTGNRIAAQSLSTNQVTTYTLPGTEANDSQGRYYLQIWTSCGNGGQTYTVEPQTSAQFANPSPVPSAAGIPASSPGSAWPPLHGGVVTRQTLGSGTDQDWYVLYKKADSAAATIRFTDTTVDGSTTCGGVFATLFDSTGQTVIQSVGLADNQVMTFSVPGKESGSAQGRYYLRVVANGCITGGQGYAIEPEPGGEWSSASTALPAGPSRKAALGPLAGNVNYTASVASSTAQDWSYFTARTALTVRVYNTSGGSAGCGLTVSLFTAGGTRVTSATVGAGKTAALKVAKAGTYSLELSTGGCKPKATVSALIDVAGSVAGPVLKVSSTTLAAGTHGKSYSATIGVSGGKKPYTFTAVTALPSGLSLSPATGKVTGKPAKKGTYAFTVTITDATRPARNVLTVLMHITIK
jgi:hypothetical protein